MLNQTPIILRIWSVSVYIYEQHDRWWYSNLKFIKRVVLTTYCWYILIPAVRRYPIMATPSGHLLLKLLVCTVVMVMVAALAPKAEEGAFVCDIIQVQETMWACRPYIFKRGELTKACCNGVKTVYRDVKTAVDRQAACECIIDLVPFNRTSETRIAGLPTKCGIPNNNCTIWQDPIRHNI